MGRSRLNQRLVKQAKRNLLIVVVGTIALVIILIFFGVKLLVNFSLLVEKKSDAITQTQEKSFIAPPLLDYLPDATNSSTLTVSGIANSGNYVKLYLNGKKIKKTDIKSDNTFVFNGVQLESGENTIKVNAIDEYGKESKFSKTATVIYSNEPPTLTIDFPSDEQLVHKESNPLKVRGKTDPDVKVTVNDFWAVVDGEGNYYYNLLLKNGENEIKVVAIDKAGNKAEKTLKVTYAE